MFNSAWVDFERGDLAEPVVGRLPFDRFTSRLVKSA